MRMALRLVAAVLAISLMGSLPVRGEQCESTTAPCRNTRSQAANCCQAMHCHCDLLAPIQPSPNPVPRRATTITGHEIVKVASLPVDAMFLAGGEYFNVRSTSRS